MPFDMQEITLINAGLPMRAIYREGRGAESVASLAKAVREGQLVGLAGGLRVLGSSHSEIADAARKLIKKGAILIDVETKERSDRDGISMMSRALARLRGEATMGDRAAEVGRLGGLARWRANPPERMPDTKALKIWQDMRIPTDDLAVAKMWGWTVPTARRHLKRSGRRKGRRSKEA